MAETKTGIFDVISGDKSFKLDIGLDVATVSYLVISALIAGTLLILISKKVIK